MCLSHVLTLMRSYSLFTASGALRGAADKCSRRSRRSEHGGRFNEDCTRRGHHRAPLLFTPKMQRNLMAPPLQITRLSTGIILLKWKWTRLGRDDSAAIMSCPVLWWSPADQRPTCSVHLYVLVISTWWPLGLDFTVWRSSVGTRGWRGATSALTLGKKVPSSGL